ncbi:hypothetical protein [Pantoea sp. B65]|uniref:hypothetical protein n=1 Tax=Pantoea sp. B65 TaxID=2813359 RepID=UPI0039B4335A
MPAPIPTSGSQLVPWTGQPSVTSSDGLLPVTSVANTPLTPAQISVFRGLPSGRLFPRGTAPVSSLLSPLRLIAAHDQQILNPDEKSAISCWLKTMPDVVEKIFRQTVGLHENTLREAMGKTGLSADDKVNITQALKQFIVTPNPDRLRGIKNIVLAHQTLSAADKNKLQQQLQQIARWTQDNLTPRQKLPDIDLLALASVLNDDVIAMLVKSGCTEAQLRNFISDSTAVKHIIDCDLLMVGSETIGAKLQSLAEDNHELAARRCEIERIIAEFESAMYSIAGYLDYGYVMRLDDEQDVFTHTLAHNYPAENLDYLADPASFDHHPNAAVSKDEVLKNRLIRMLEINFLRSYPLIKLFQQIYRHSPLIMERSILNAEQLNLFNNRDDIRKLGWQIMSQYAERARMLLANMDIVPFIFGDTLQPPPVNTTEVCGYRGLPFHVIDHWLSNEKISAQRLRYIMQYCNERLGEISETGEIDLAWMEPFTDATLERFFCTGTDLTHYLYDGEGFFFGRALKKIGQMIIRPDYDHKHLPEFLAWVREKLGCSASDNDLAYLLFFNQPNSQDLVTGWLHNPAVNALSLRSIASKIHLAEIYPQKSPYPQHRISDDLQRVIKKLITPAALNNIQRVDRIRDSVNNLLPRERVLSFIAQHFAIRVIQEDGLDEFQRYYDLSGEEYTSLPAEQAAALVVRPGRLTPVNADGSLRETIGLESGDNHTLLREVLRYIRYRDGFHPDGEQLDQALFALEQQLPGIAGIQ